MNRRSFLQAAAMAPLSLGLQRRAIGQARPAHTGAGWISGALSNNERFARGAATTFVAAGESNEMERGFVYAGNAKNAMILADDRAVLEQANVVAMYSHGNTDGPSLEYVPQPLNSNLSGYWPLPYRWGEDGAVQWVFIGGCEALGFARLPDGTIDLQRWVSPLRWMDAFQGISGICGFRSLSYYWNDAQGGAEALGSQYGHILMMGLLGGLTMWDAWRQSASWLHGTLNHQAEVCCYPSQEAAYRDTLSEYSLERVRRLRSDAIRSTIVGTGAPPEFDYCPNLDWSGKPTCQNRSSASTQSDALVLPIASYEPASFHGLDVEPRQRVLPALTKQSGLPVTVDGSALAEVTPSRIVVMSARQSRGRSKIIEQLRRYALQASAGNGLSVATAPLAAARSSSKADTQIYQRSRTVRAGGATFPLCLDSGIQELTGNDYSSIIAHPGYRAVRVIDRRRLPRAAEALTQLEDALEGTRISLRRAEPVYIPARRGQQRLLYPALQVFYDRTLKSGVTLHELQFL